MERLTGPESKSLTSTMRSYLKTINDLGEADWIRIWRVYNQDISRYEHYFKPVLKPDTIVDFVRRRSPPVTIIDLMAPSSALNSLFQQIPDTPKLGISVSLEDWRNDQEKDQNSQLNIHHLQGDIMKSSTWQAIDEVLKGQKADLIIEKGQLGLQFIPINKKLYFILINKAWRILSRHNGILLAETPHHLLHYHEEIPMKQWIRLLNKNGIAASYNSDYDAGLLKIIKNPDSPEDLPSI